MKFTQTINALFAVVTLVFPSLSTALTNPNETTSTSAKSIHEFHLTDQFGKDFGLEQLKGKWSFIFIGYTSCPDVCPTTMMELNFAFPQLQKLSNNTSQVILVSADPKRDSQDKLKDYIKYFNKSFIALRGEHERLKPFTQNLGLIYKINQPSTPQGFYLVDHSAAVVLVNPDAEIQTFFKPKENEHGILSVDTDEMVENFEIISSFYQ